MVKPELLQKSLTELNTELAEARHELRELRFRAAEGQLREVRRIRALRVQVAELSAALVAKQPGLKAA